MMNKSFAYIFLIVILFNSCNSNDSNIITVKAIYTDFVEKLDVAGTVQSVNVMSIVAPRIPVSSMTVAYLADDGSTVRRGDTICILSAPEILSRLETYTTDLEKLMADSKKLVADNALALSMLEVQIDNNKAQLELNSLDSIQQKFAPPLNQKLIKLELDKALVEKNKLKKKYESLKRISIADNMRMRSRISQSENIIQMTKMQVNSLFLLSPIDGMIMHVVAPQMIFMSSSGMGVLGGNIEVNSSVWSNMAVLQVPDLSKMQISIEVAEADFKRIEKGQKVRIKVEAANDLVTTGSVLKKAPVGKKSQSESQVKIYEVVVSVDSLHQFMTPGLSAKCNIMISEVKDTIVVPAISIFRQDSAKIVYVSDGNKFIPVIVETGLSNSSETIISSGLNGTEIIALTEPLFNMRKKITNPKTHKVLTPDSLKTLD